MGENGILGQELFAFALALIILAISGSIIRFISLPVLLGYLLAGLLFQPLLRPFPSLILLSSVGVILLLFFLGMEFDLRRLLTSPRRLLLSFIDFILNFGFPFILFLFIGLPYQLAFIVAMAIYPTSSAMTIGALLQLRRIANPETETIVWILVGEDLAIIILLPIASSLTGGKIGLISVATAFAFIILMLIASLVLTKPLEWFFERVPSELDDLVTISIIFFVSAVAHILHLSEALGAFLAGLLFSGTKDREELEQRLYVLRELGIATFFFTFGLQTSLKISSPGALLGLSILILGLVMKIITAWFSSIVEGLRQRARLRLFFSLLIRGEFSIIALYMGNKILPKVWQEAMSFFLIASIFVGLIALWLGGKLSEKIVILNKS